MVARFTLPREDVASGEGKAMAELVESAIFDPWQPIPAHRSLADVQRALKMVYFESQKGYGAV